MTERQRYLASINREVLERPAVTCTGAITVDGIVNAGIDPATMWQDGNALAKLAKAEHDMCGFEDLNLFTVWTHLEALGADVNYQEGKGIPYLRQPLFKLGDDYQMPDMDRYVKHPAVVRTVSAFKRARQLAGKDTAVTMVTSWGPLTNAGHLIGTEELMMQIAMEPDEVKKLLRFCAEYSAEAYKAELAAGYIDDWVAYLTNPLGARPTPITTLPSHASPADAQFDTVGERNAVGQVQGDGAGPQRR